LQYVLYNMLISQSPDQFSSHGAVSEKREKQSSCINMSLESVSLMLMYFYALQCIWRVEKHTGIYTVEFH